MKLSTFKAHLRNHPDHDLTFVLPDGGCVPAHFHITEAGRVDKSFMDCGATIRRTATCSLQAWVAGDTGHRIMPGKLAKVLEIAAPLFQGEDLDVEIEYEDGFVSQFPVLDSDAADGALVFQLGTKHTDCLAKEVCTPQSATEEGYCAPGCCS